MPEIKFAKVKPNAIFPSKSEENAGFDIYACFDEDSIEIKPHQTKLIPTGIASSCDKEWFIQLNERGSTGSKGIGLRAGVIDSGYRGEWFVALTNERDDMSFVISKSEGSYCDCIHYPYEKAIAQAILLPVPYSWVEEVTYEELLKIESNRGVGSLGSSGK